MQPFTIKTSRLVLRIFKMSDFETWAHAQRSRRPRKDLHDRKPLPNSKINKAYFKTAVKHWNKVFQSGEAFPFAIFLKKDGAFLGTVGLDTFRRGHFQIANLGYSLLNQHWGNGYATEACQAIIRVGFQKLKYHRIEAGIEPSNKRSLAVAKKLKMKKEGLRRSYFFSEGIWHDMVYFELIETDLGFKSLNC